MIPPSALPGAADFAARLVAILYSVTQLIFARGHLFAALAIPLHNRIVRASQRLAKLLARLANGSFRPRAHTPKPGSKGGPPAIALPRGHAWLTRKFGYQLAGAYALQLEHLLRDPQTQALLAAAPPEALKSLGRTLRPICRLLGVPLPAPLLLSPRQRRGEPEGGQPPRQPKPKPPKPKLPPLLPLYPQRRPRDLPFMRFAPKIKPA